MQKHVDLFQQGQYGILINELRTSETLMSQISLSMLLRLQNMYKDEWDITQKSLQTWPYNPYFQERKAWHDLSPFEKMESRPPLHLERDVGSTPKQETLDQLCIVTGGDSNYFEFIVELIESVKNTILYKDKDIYVLDSGLLDTEKEYLEKKLLVKAVIPIEWDIPFQYMRYINMERPKEASKCYQTVMAARFLHKYIPNYNYYLYMQPDGWINDERGIDKFVKLAETQGAAFHLVFNWTLKDVPFFEHSPIEPNIKEKISHYPCITEGIWCVSKSFMEVWSEQYKEMILKYQFWLGLEEVSGNIVLHRTSKNPKVLENVVGSAYYNSYANLENWNAIMCMKTDLPVGFFILPTDIANNSTAHSLKENKNSRNLDNFYGPISGGFPALKKYSEVMAPLRYRIWPWRNKEALTQKLEEVLSYV